MAPLSILLLSFLIFLIFNAYILRNRYSVHFLGRLALAIMLIFTGSSHFYKTEEMVQMMPNFLPYKMELVYFTGVFEIVAAVGLVIRRYARLTSILLVVFLILVLPANIVGSLKRIEIGGMENGPAYLFFRIPLQVFFIGLLYYFGIRPRNKRETKMAEQISNA